MTRQRSGEAQQEIREFLTQRVDEIKALTAEDRAVHGRRAEILQVSSGATYRTESIVRLYRGRYGTQAEIEVWAYALRGWRRWAPHFERGTLKEEDLRAAIHQVLPRDSG